MKRWFWNFIETLVEEDGSDGVVVTVEGNSFTVARCGMEM
jgi:hypothetical protein